MPSTTHLTEFQLKEEVLGNFGNTMSSGPPLAEILTFHLLHKELAHSGVPDRFCTQSDLVVFGFGFVMILKLTYFILPPSSWVEELNSWDLV